LSRNDYRWNDDREQPAPPPEALKRLGRRLDAVEQGLGEKIVPDPALRERLTRDAQKIAGTRPHVTRLPPPCDLCKQDRGPDEGPCPLCGRTRGD
jgi:hypothetical protein